MRRRALLVQVRMPEVQLYQFYASGAIGLLAASPLLHERALSATAIVTFVSALTYATRTIVKWRQSKALYQQLLLSYQYRNRLGSSDGALLCVGQVGSRCDPSPGRSPVRQLL